jgi:NTP pyrophosphatase (non-canonical NTP hydrolase)
MPEPAVAAAVARLDELTRRLRRECPWDREQDERTIVPHTVEEAYELADAANAGDDAKLRDELGDVLFQVHFLSLLLEERGAGDMAQVAEHVRQKLIRRHPHVFGAVEAETAGEVLRNCPRTSRRCCTRARSSAVPPARASTSTASPTTPSAASSRSSRPPAPSARRPSTRSATCSSRP